MRGFFLPGYLVTESLIEAVILGSVATEDLL